MKISFDRRAYEGETRVLTSFEKKMDIPDATAMETLVEQYVFHYLGLAELPADRRDWNLIAVKDMSHRPLARIRDGHIQWIQSQELTAAAFFGPADTIAIIGMTPASQARQKEKDAVSEVDGWNEIALPIRIDTKDIQVLALFAALAAIVSLISLIMHYNNTKVILAEALVAFLGGALACYFILLKGRRISFNDHIVVYRNRFNRYERFTPDQFDHVEWFGPAHDIKFVFKYEEKSRNFISAKLRNNFKLILWAKYQGIGIYSSNP